jgi:RpiB/LacA/LacB family sugar-phosphate isomerase
MKGMRIALGADHRGFNLKMFLKNRLEGEGLIILDFGCDTDREPSDYPDFSIKVANSVAKKESDYGILVCMTGIGMTIAANKVRGARAALCRSSEDAYFSRAHNNANILCLAAKDFEDSPEYAFEIVKKFISTSFEGGRHKRRVDKVIFYEDKNSCE